jgi:SAM-dependent methyltransferase
MSRARMVVIGAALGGLAGIVSWVVRERSNPSACPYGQRFFLDLPRPLMRRGTLRELLALSPGERVLEVGPGTGYYSLDVAPRLAPGGQLDVVDLQQPMLDELIRRASARGITGIVPTHGDARLLPYPDGTFDAAFMVATLGEVPSPDLALRELRRVLKPDGRLVIGEGQPDPHMLPLDDLRQRAHAAGFDLDRHVGGRLGYLARFGVSQEP